jgi:hypothetical protein
MSLKEIYIKNINHITITNINKYEILNYEKDYITNDNRNTLGLFRSVIMKDNKILCISPGKTYELNSFLNKYSKYKIEEYIEGIMINCFYDNEWHIATYDSIDNKTICEIFKGAFNEENWKLMNKTNTYTFIFQDPSLELINNKQSKIYLIDVYDKSFNSIKDELKNKSMKDILLPNEIDIPLEEAIKRYCNINSDYSIKGLLLKSEDNVRTKIRNSSFEYFKYILNTDSIKIIFEYCYYSKRKEPHFFIQKYGNDSLNIIKRTYFDMTYNLYLTYRNIYIRKTDTIDNYNGYKKNILVKLHYEYINKLRIEKKYITKKYVIEYVNNLSSYDKFMLLSKISSFYKLLNKLRI